MPILFQYLIKLSCGLTIVYLFYELVLRRLTFFNSNRWYLLGCSLLCFLIPAININSLVEPQQLSTSGVVQFIPAIDNYIVNEAVTVQQTTISTLSIWDGCCIVLALGSLLLLMRLLIQYISYRKIRRAAQLLARDAINIYQVDKPIAPFSFGRNIFINQQLHTEAELQEIIRHELVHVKQHHTVDIILTEIICILNWYNPFAWLLRHAVRQNLEFIADSHVIQSGVDKKDYQYLLLKVIGTAQFSLANQFNFSSLKKRIVMINKMRSSKAHLVKFLLALPLAVILLIAFRTNAQEQKEDETITISGLVLDGRVNKNTEPLEGVSVNEKFSNTTVLTDHRGYFLLTIPAKKFPIETEIIYTKEGFNEHADRTNIESRSKESLGLNKTIIIAGPGAVRVHPVTYNVILNEKNSVDGKTGRYEAARKQAEDLKTNIATQNELKKLSENSEKPYWVINGSSYILANGGLIVSTSVSTDIIFVDGKKMTGDEVNKKIKRSSIRTVGAVVGENAKKKYGIDGSVLEVYTNTSSKPDNVVAPPSVVSN